MDFKSLSSNQRFALNVFIPLLYFFPLAVAYGAPKNFGFGYRSLVYCGLAIGIVGVSLWILSTLHLGKSLAVLPGADTLVTRGIYGYLRNPMYLGILMTLFGLLLACGSMFGVIYVAVVVLPLNLVRSRLEEKALREKFGEAYLNYRNRTWF